jgi:hypothetical protein
MIKRKAGDNSNILIQQIDIRQVNRSTVDIETWRTAIRSAESVINPTRKLLYDLYADMMLDGRLSSAIGKRIMAITTTELKFSENGKDNDDINALINTEEFAQLQEYILESIFYGYSLISFEFLPDKIVPTLIDRRHVKPELNLVVRNPGDMSGIDYTVPPHTDWTIAVGNPKNLGKIMAVCQYVIYKRGGFGDWAQFAELFGMPFRKGKYNGYDEQARKMLDTALKEMGSAAYVIIPEGTDVDVIQNYGNAGSNAVYKELRLACNEEISTSILGQTLTMTQGDKGARSLGEVHKDVEDAIYLNDRKFILKVLNNKLIPLLQKHGYPVGNGKFGYPEQENISKPDRLKMDLQLAAKVPVSDDYFYETYGIPKPDNYDQIAKEKKDNANAMKKLAEKAAADPVKNTLIRRLVDLFSQEPSR